MSYYPNFLFFRYYFYWLPVIQIKISKTLILVMTRLMEKTFNWKILMA